MEKNSSLTEVTENNIWTICKMTSSRVSTEASIIALEQESGSRVSGIATLCLEWSDGTIHAAVCRKFLADCIGDALAQLRVSRSIGIIVLSILQTMFSSNCGQPVVLASGGAGGIGRAVTTYFQCNRVLPVLLSRRKRNSRFGESTVKATTFENSALKKSLQCLPQGQQLKHVLQLAAVLWDINMSLGTTEMTDYVLKQKVFGAWSMHSLTTA